MKKIKEIKVANVNGVTYVNTTPHDINCLDSESNLIIVPASGILVNASANTVDAGSKGGIKLVKTEFVPNETGAEILEELEELYPGCIVIDSLIAAQAYPGKVFGLVVCEGYERVAPPDKRMRLDMFTTFEKLHRSKKRVSRIFSRHFSIFLCIFN